MRLLVLISLSFYYSCSNSHKIIDVQKPKIGISKTDCGSYEVANDEKIIGYIVKPYLLEINAKENYISDFENLLQRKYRSFYKNYFRTFWFIPNSVADTILVAVMLSPNEIKNIPKWQCEEQDIDTYKRNHENLFNDKHPQFIAYNCSKGRFKILSDPD